MKIELTINKSKDLPRGAIPALETELLKRLQNQYENCSLVIRRAGGDSQTVSTLIESMASVDGTTTFTVTERLDWSFPNPRVLIRYQDGSASSLMVATSAGDYRVSVPYLATFDDMILDDPGIEPPRLIFCDSSRVGYNALVSEIAPQSDGTCQITAKQYKTSFYDHDNATYPGDTA